MSATNALESFIGNALFSGASLAVTEWELGLFVTAPGEDGTGGVEVSDTGTGYARITVAAGNTHWAKSATQDGQGRTVYHNAVTLQFPNATANWGTVSVLGLYSQTHGLCFVTPLTTARTIMNGDLGPTLLAGDLEIAIG